MSIVSLILTLYLSIFANINQPTEFIQKDTEYYNYCPSSIYENNLYYTYFCSNENKNEVKDSIYVCTTTFNFKCSDRINVLSPSLENAWDSKHVCDPSVIEYTSLYNGQEYKYLMAYLGCDRLDNQHNQIGLAVSNDKLDKFIKIDSNPFISAEFTNDSNTFEWGVGQPSLLNTSDGILIFYTVGNKFYTYENVELWNLTDLNNPIKLWEITISTNGINDYISNADFAIDGNDLYMICDNHDYFGNIPSSSAIYKTTLNNYIDLENCIWTKVKNIDMLAQNHNCGFIRTSKGILYNKSYLYTYANKSLNWKKNLMSYTIYYDKIK